MKLKRVAYTSCVRSAMQNKCRKSCNGKNKMGVSPRTERAMVTAMHNVNLIDKQKPNDLI